MKQCVKCLLYKDVDNFYYRHKYDCLYSSCKSCMRLYSQQQSKEYRKKNKAKVAEYNKRYNKKRLHENLAFKLAANLRSRLSKAIKRGSKRGSAVDDLGCSVLEFKQYLESKFQSGMAWNNYGKWHIDHIKPLASFNLDNPEEFKKAVNYLNLQPLWAEQNLKKSSR